MLRLVSMVVFGAGLSAVAYGQSDSTGYSGADHDFMMEAASGGKTEVRLGQMASYRVQRDDVRQLGRLLMSDSTRAGVELSTLACKEGVDLPFVLNDKDVVRVDQLAQRPGYAFDLQYMSGMVRDDERDVAAYEKEVRQGKDPAVRDWARKTLPALREHLKLSRAIEHQMMLGKSASR